MAGFVSLKFCMMNVSARKDQVTVCKGNTCLTVVGELAKALAFVAVIGVTVWTVNEITKVFK